MQPDMLGQVSKTAALFTACLLAILILPILVMLANGLVPDPLANILFFAPQFVFPYGALARRSAYPMAAPLGGGISMGITLLQWGIVAVGFGWIVRERGEIWQRIIGAVAVIVIVTIFAHIVLGIAGWGVTLDGP